MMQSYYILLKQQGRLGKSLLKSGFLFGCWYLLDKKRGRAIDLPAFGCGKNEGVHDYFELSMLE